MDEKMNDALVETLDETLGETLGETLNETPPLFPSWNYWYALVILLLLAQIIVFSILST